jgi:hypothetical protein
MTTSSPIGDISELFSQDVMDKLERFQNKASGFMQNKQNMNVTCIKGQGCTLEIDNTKTIRLNPEEAKKLATTGRIILFDENGKVVQEYEGIKLPTDINDVILNTDKYYENKKKLIMENKRRRKEKIEEKKREKNRNVLMSTSEPITTTSTSTAIVPFVSN